MTIKVLRIENNGADIVNEGHGEIFIPIEDVADVISKLVNILNVERLEWREEAGG